MKITPLEIRQKSFEKKLRGYDKDEVTGFLQSLSQEWEHLQDEVKALRIKNENAEKEIKQLREVENSLFKTLKTAEDTGANLIDQATKTAQLHMRETQMNADALLNEAKSKARASIEEADAKARNILDDMESDIKALKIEYTGLENLRDNILAELRNLANDTLQRVEKISVNALKSEMSQAKEKQAKAEVPKVHENLKVDAEEQQAGPVNAEQPKEHTETEQAPEENKLVNSEAESHTDDSDEDSSFFDQIK
jgi:cell division initiation protein